MKRIACCLLVLACAPAVVAVPAGGELPVGDEGDDGVSRLSLQDGGRIGEIAGGEGPHEIAVSVDSRIAVVDTVAWRVGGDRETGNRPGAPGIVPGAGA